MIRVYFSGIRSEWKQTVSKELVVLLCEMSVIILFQ